MSFTPSSGSMRRQPLLTAFCLHQWLRKGLASTCKPWALEELQPDVIMMMWEVLGLFVMRPTESLRVTSRPFHSLCISGIPANTLFEKPPCYVRSSQNVGPILVPLNMTSRCRNIIYYQKGTQILRATHIQVLVIWPTNPTPT